MIREQGYPAERHWVQTKDGYILSLYRIPTRNFNARAGIGRKVMLCMHGLFDSAPAYLVMGKNRAAGMKQKTF